MIVNSGDLESMAAHSFATTLVSKHLLSGNLTGLEQLATAESLMQQYMAPEEADRFVGYIQRVSKRVKQTAALKAEYGENGLEAVAKHFKISPISILSVKFYPHFVVIYTQAGKRPRVHKGMIVLPDSYAFGEGDEIEQFFGKITTVGKLERAVLLNLGDTRSSYLYKDMFTLVNPEPETKEDPVDRCIEEGKYFLTSNLSTALLMFETKYSFTPREMVNNASSYDKWAYGRAVGWLTEKEAYWARRAKDRKSRLRKLEELKPFTTPIVEKEKRMIQDALRVKAELPQAFRPVLAQYEAMLQELLLKSACSTITGNLEPDIAQYVLIDSGRHLRTLGFDEAPESVEILSEYSFSKQGVELEAQMEQAFMKVL